MTDIRVHLHARADGSLVVQPHGTVDLDCAEELRRVLVHALRKRRPRLLILDLGDVSDVDPINLGTLAAACDLADDHQIAVVVENPSRRIARKLTAAGVPRQRLHGIRAAA